MVVITDELSSEIKQVAGNKRLPTLPAVAQKLIELAQQDEIELHEVCQVVRSDPAVSGKILKTANSALFGFRARVESIEEAVPKLGTSMIRTLILSFHLAANSQGETEYQSYYQQMWRNFLTQAVFAELIAEQTDCDQASCFMAGLLQDIGVLAMLSEFGDEYIENVLERASLPDVADAERRHFGFSHIDISEQIVQQWNLGKRYWSAIRHHHDHMTPVDVAETDFLKTILQAASLGASVVASRRASKRRLDELLHTWIDFLELHFQLEQDVAHSLISEVNERVREYSVVFDFKIDDGIQTNRVIADAKELLQELAIQNQMKAMNNGTAPNDPSPEQDEMFRDCLTGLYNRRFLNQCLNQKIKSWIDKRKPIAMLFLDVDKFKSINDEHGHRIGDNAITHVAQWLMETTRATDYVVRLGGDEFLVIMQLKQSLCEKIANRIVEEIPVLPIDGGQDLPMSLSIGCVHYQPKRRENHDASWLIDQADQLMYSVKKNGGAGLSMQTV